MTSFDGAGGVEGGRGAGGDLGEWAVLRLSAGPALPPLLPGPPSQHFQMN